MLNCIKSNTKKTWKSILWLEAFDA